MKPLAQAAHIPGTPDAERSAPQFLWNAEDVQAGMIVCRAHRDYEPWAPNGWTSKWTQKIGFVPGDGETVKDPVTRRYQSGHYCQIAVTDGMVYCRGLTKGQMAALLQENDMIPMPWAWWLKTVRYLQKQTNPKLRA